MKVEIMGREALVQRAKEPFPANVAVISITDSDGADVELSHQPAQLLRLKFDDVSDEIFQELLGRRPGVREMHKLSQRFHMLSNTQTQQLSDFILEFSGRTDILICQCEYGQSRSAAVAAAVLEYHSQRGIRIFADSRYYPNKYVFRKLLRALRMRGRPGCP